MIIMFVLKVILYNMEEKGLSRSEKTIAYLMIGLYYIVYFNSMYKFGMSFYNIMRNSLIDDSDIMMMEIIATFIFGLMYFLYGVLYHSIYYNIDNMYYGIACMALGFSIFLQCFLLRKYYIHANDFKEEAKKKDEWFLELNSID